MILNHRRHSNGTWTIKAQYKHPTNGKSAVDLPLETLQKDEPVACARYIREWIVEDESKQRTCNGFGGPLHRWAKQVIDDTKRAALPGPAPSRRRASTEKKKKKKRTTGTRAPLVPSRRSNANTTEKKQVATDPKPKAKGRRLTPEGRTKRNTGTTQRTEVASENVEDALETPMPTGMSAAVATRPTIKRGPLKKRCRTDGSSLSGCDENNSESDGDDSFSY
jgi:hypothetical protein